MAPQEATDVNGHVDDLEYLRWIQEVATQHSGAEIWRVGHYLKMQTWGIWSHHSEYLRAAFQ
jgi:acyl-CoA thioester hydrolase